MSSNFERFNRILMGEALMGVQYSSVAQSCLTLCDPMGYSTPGFPIHYQLPELAQTHVHRVGDTIQPTPPLSSPSLPSIFPSIKVFSSESASVLPMNIQNWFPLGWTGWISLQFKGLSESSPTPQFKSISSLVLRLLYGPTLKSVHDYWKNHSFDYRYLCQQSDIFDFLVWCAGVS